jgi:hypothetical protein
MVYIFLPKSQFVFYILEGFGMEKVGEVMSNCNILRSFGILHGHLARFVVIWYIFPVLVCCTKTNMATLIAMLLM